MRVLALVVLVTRRRLHVETNDTRTLSLLLAMSSGLHTVTDMNPPSNPAMKLTIFSLFIMWCGSIIKQYIHDFTINIIIRNHITMYDSFWMGASFSFIARLVTFRMLRWPHTSGTLGLSQPRSRSFLNSSLEALSFL